MAKQRPFFRSLRGKVSLQMLIVSLIPILVIGGIVWSSMVSLEDNTKESVDTSHDAMEEDVIQETLSQDAYRLALEWEKDMATRIDYVQTYASAPVCQNALASGNRNTVEAQAANDYLAEQLTITPYFQAFTVIDANGTGVSGAINLGPEQGIQAGIFFAYDMLFQNDFTQMDWWDAYMASDGTYVSDAYWVEAQTVQMDMGLWVVDIVHEIKDTDDNVVGALFGTTVIEPTEMSRDYAVKYPNTRVMVFNRSNEIVADSGEWVLSDTDINGDGELNDAVPRQTQTVDWSDDPQPVLRWHDQQMKTRIPEENVDFTPAEKRVRQVIGTARKEVITADAFTTEDGNYVVGYARAATTSLEENLQTPGYAGTGYTFMTEKPEEYAFAALKSLDKLESDLEDNTQSVMVTVVVILIVALVLVLIVAFFLSRSITRPIIQLSEAAEKVSMGDLEVTVDVKSDDEIGDLADSFGRMVAAYRFMAQDDEEE